ncbi:MAG: nitrite/sulfite reductase [bacterium]
MKAPRAKARDSKQGDRTMRSEDGSRWAEPLDSEIATIRDQIERFRRGELAPEKFRALRLVNGIYGQRQPDVHMLRVKIPNGVLDPAQVEALAEVAEHHGHGVAHVTTRQDIQYHYIPLEEMPDVLERLARAGLMSREACGNSVRNVTSCPMSGVCRDEPFPVLPYAQAVARFLLRHPAAQLLGRKFKIAFSGCESDCAAGAIHDIGAIATVSRVNGQEEFGFRLLVGGGLGPTPYVAQLVDEFVPAGEILRSCEAVVRLFALHGNRKNRAAARSKFIMAKWGVEKFRATYTEILVSLQRAQNGDGALHIETYLKPEELALLGTRAALAPREPTNGNGNGDGNGNGHGTPTHAHIAKALPGDDAPLHEVFAGASVLQNADFRRWLDANCVRQRQPGLAAITIALPLGDANAPQLRQIAAVAREFARGDVRATIQQNILIREVAVASLPDAFARLASAGLAAPTANSALDVTSCPGADTCNLGITSSRGLARAISAEFARSGADAVSLRGERIKISGCPNACGQHHTASIGFHGVARKITEQPAPFYQMHLGGKVRGVESRLAKGNLYVPAKNAPAVVRLITEHFLRTRNENEGLADFLDRVPIDEIRALLRPLLDPTIHEEGAPDYFHDWDRPEIFTTSTIGTGECAGAGADATADPFEETVIGLRESTRLFDQGHSVDALCEANRAVIAAARIVLAQGAGKETHNDWETLCEFRSRLFDRGHASDTWERLREEIDALSATKVPAADRVAALQREAAQFLEECRALLAALRAWKNDPGASPLPGLSAHGSGEAIG